MTVAVDCRRMLSWPQQSHHAPYCYRPTYSPYHGIPPKNTKELNREMLINVLEHLSSLLEVEFGGTAIRLVAHGGACMLLHPGLYDLARRKALYHSSMGENVQMRKTTRDVDYIRRSFIAEYVGKYKILDADYRLQKCIRATAVKFGLGADWMNADADVALPMSTTSAGTPYDPIYHASLQPFNVRLYTVYTSKNKKLSIVNVTPAWAVALKLVRYAKWDPGDISLLLMNGTNLSKVHWTTKVIKKWLIDECSAMSYHKWDANRLLDMQSKIEHAVQMVTSIGTNLPPAQDCSTPAAASGLVAPSTGLTSTSTRSAQRTPPVPAPDLSFSQSLRLLGPSVSLDSGSYAWNASGTNNAFAVDENHAPTPTRKKKKRKEGHENHKTPSGLIPQITSAWHLEALQAALPDTTNHSVRRSRSAEFDSPVPFIPDMPSDPLSWKRPQPPKEKQRLDKHAERRKERQRRDRARDFDRRFKWEGRGGLLDDPRESFTHHREEVDSSDTDESSSSSNDEEENAGKSSGFIEYVPMPTPPSEVYTREWQEQRDRQDDRWRERYGGERATSTDNRVSLVEDNQHGNSSTGRHWHRPQHSQTWPVPTSRNSDLMMSLYTPRESPSIPATNTTQQMSPPSLKSDPSAQTHDLHLLRHRRSYTSPRLSVH
ncbi:hypothetical protein E1B28_002953 [Marasmius oreades]|uniref:Uncharacterized protein n=1 Tax=Marasmius oreades TaxID=181124 RepID=A0A9P7RJI5_9AGAR|nr:uncharacterized protein E1B28_002953 [Marasmius oreades]KAG7085391.1 hypothetical protein E1B28_002953 [Marasmius oreades]